MSNLAQDISALQAWLAAHPALVVLTGAGISAASGIPTYRDHHGRWQHNAPITHKEFISDPERRQRYWTRSLAGWPAVRDARPNAAHKALASLERSGRLRLLITQNVDRLHQRAGSCNALDLHGRLDRVNCLQCGHSFHREQIQQQLLAENPPLPGAPAHRLPDGDSDLEGAALPPVRPPGCRHCRGTLMPDVVFFGGTVPGSRVQHCREAIAGADALLVIGSSLQVYSGFRFCRHAASRGVPIAIINPGATRADPLAAVKFHSECGPLLAGALAGTLLPTDV